MTSEGELHLVSERGWSSGFANLLRQEYSRWWRTRLWLIQSVTWLVILNGLVAGVLWLAQVRVSDGGPELDRATVGLQVFIQLLGVFAPIGVMILGQSAIVGEKQSGTAAWVLSKPVSRSAFILAKLLANAFGILITVVVLQAPLVYLQLWGYSGDALPLVGYLVALLVLLLNMLFYLSLTLMLGTFFSGRGPVIAIPIAFLFGQSGIAAAGVRFDIRWLPRLLPERLPELAGGLAQAQPLPEEWPTPLVATAVCSVVFIAVALWRFGREEF